MGRGIISTRSASVASSFKSRRPAVIVWMEYTCNLSGGTYKFVECEECKQKYV
jgi:hypothetical protein